MRLPERAALLCTLLLLLAGTAAILLLGRRAETLERVAFARRDLAFAAAGFLEECKSRAASGAYGQDAIETAAVNGLYVSGGKSKADFSIGRFQMKPSFAEEIDKEWNKSKLIREFDFIFDVRDNADARRNRLKRLGTTIGQCRYLAIFIRLMSLRHPSLALLPEDHQVRFLATAYNQDHTVSWEENIRMQKRRTFHTDMLKTNYTKTYRYSDIAVAFYQLNNNKPL